MNRRTLLAGTALGLGSPALWAAARTNVIRIGVTRGPHEEIMNEVKRLAAPRGLHLTVIAFDDFVSPNVALMNNLIDANAYQHRPYMNRQNADRGFDLVDVAKTVSFPFSFYSVRGYRCLNDLPDKAVLGIPNDVTNADRALGLLARHRLLKFDQPQNTLLSVLDIAENPRRLHIIECEAAQLARDIHRLDAAAITGNHAYTAKLQPLKDGIAGSGKTDPYANVICVRRQNRNAPWVRDLVGIYHTPAVARFIREHFGPRIQCAW